jgi:hypothetical protein
MRFMLLMIPGDVPDEQWAAGPDEEGVAAMGRFNEALTKAGVLLAADGLQAPSKGARVTYAGGKPAVTDGPFTEAKELVGGYWIIQAKSKEEAVEWATRIPGGEQDIVEVRQIYELSDFPQEVQDAAQLSEPPREQPLER